MNIQNIKLRRQESTTASAPSLIASLFKSNNLTVNDSNLSCVKTSNESVNAQQLHPDNTFLITKSASSLLTIQQDHLTSALKLKRKNFLLKSASEDSSNFKQNNEQQQDTHSQLSDSQSNDFNLLQQHQPTRWRRFLQMKRGKSVCESFTDLSTSSLTTSTETETTSNDTNLKILNQDNSKLKTHLFYSTQSTQSLTNKLDHRIINKLTNSKSTKSDNKLYNKKVDSQTNQSTDINNAVLPSSSSYGFKYHKRRRSRRGSYKSQLRSNRNNLTAQYFRTSFDSAIQNQITKRNANLNLQETTRAISFDNSCLTSSHNYSNATISSLGLSYLIEDINQLSLDDNER